MTTYNVQILSDAELNELERLVRKHRRGVRRIIASRTGADRRMRRDDDLVRREKTKAGLEARQHYRRDYNNAPERVQGDAAARLDRAWFIGVSDTWLFATRR